MRRPAAWGRRLLCALAVSVVLHLGLLASAVTGEAPRAPAPALPALNVRLVPAVTAKPDPIQTEPESSHQAVAPAAAAAASLPAARAQARHGLPVPAGAEPRYHAARELDVFPRLAQPELPHLPVASGGGAAVVLRLALFIDAHGRVRRIAALDAGQPEAAVAALRILWKDLRFYPARKSGLAVASRVEIELAYGAAGSAR